MDCHDTRKKYVSAKSKFHDYLLLNQRVLSLNQCKNSNDKKYTLIYIVSGNMGVFQEFNKFYLFLLNFNSLRAN